jgi:hypothetical protein
MKIIIIILLLSKFSINFAIEISSHITVYGFLNESVIFKINNDYFPKEYSHDLETVRKILWVNNHGVEILTYNTQAKEVIMKNYTERIRFNQEKGDLTIENVRLSDCGDWRLYFQNSNEGTRLYILTFELEILKEIDITLKSVHQEINNSSKIEVRCENDYRGYNSNKCKIPNFLHNISLITNSVNINQKLQKEKSLIDENLSIIHNDWYFIVQNDEIIDNLSVFCSINKLNSSIYVENKIEIKSKTLAIKVPMIESSLKINILYKSYNLNYINDSFRISCENSFPSSKHFIFEGILKETDLINSTNSIDDLLSFMRVKLGKLERRNLKSKIINYTCLEYDDSSSKLTHEYLIQTYIVKDESFHLHSHLGIQSKLHQSTVKETCENCGTIITISIFTLLVLSAICIAYGVKYYKNKRNRETNNVTSENNRFYEELNIQFEQSSLKHKTEGNELKIYLA